jgi:hypothetical protein
MFVDIDGQLQVKSQIHKRTQQNDLILIKVYCLKDESIMVDNLDCHSCICFGL